ncbi:MAG TPA: tryptophan synthase subunit alpha [Bacteroidia bacterium]
MERIKNIFREKGLLSIYFTAGYPELNDTVEIIKCLESSDVDLVEIGIPFSDPLADGTVIQSSNEIALKNGMTLQLLFDQLKDIRKEVSVPLILMGYFNPVMQYGVEKFCAVCSKIGIDGVIIPDLPLDEYLFNYKTVFEKYGLANILLVTPATSDKRLKQIDEESNAFIYFVSANSTTGNKDGIKESKRAYFNKAHQLNNPVLIGFGIKDHSSFREACVHANGAIIGTAFINALKEGENFKEKIPEFIQKIKVNRGNNVILKN